MIERETLTLKSCTLDAVVRGEREHTMQCSTCLLISLTSEWCTLYSTSEKDRIQTVKEMKRQER